MSDNLVSIIIPCFNARKWIGECLQSCLAQTYKNVEIIVVDDGSTDESVAIISSFRSSKIKLVQQGNRGACAARNNGLRLAKGQWIQYLDADDLISENKLQEQITLLQGRENFLAICPTVIFFDEQNPFTLPVKIPEFIQRADSPSDLLIKMWGGRESAQGGRILPGAWLSPRSVVEQAGLWDETLTADQDGEYFCRVVLKSLGVVLTADAAHYYRKISNYTNLSAQENVAAYESRLRSIYSKKRNLFLTCDNTLARQAIAFQAISLALRTYPSYRAISYKAMSLADEMGYGMELFRGKRPKLYWASKWLNWKICAYLLFLYRRLGYSE